MKHIVSKYILFVSALAVGSLLTAPAVHAENEGLSAVARKMEKHQARRDLSVLKKYDANGNGVLDPAELAAKRADAKAKRDAATLKKYDANANGVLDPEEVAKEEADAKAKHDAAVLKKYDRNHNGVLDADELAAKQANDHKMQALRDARAKKIGANKANSAGTSNASGQM